MLISGYNLRNKFPLNFVCENSENKILNEAIVYFSYSCTMKIFPNLFKFKVSTSILNNCEKST